MRFLQFAVFYLGIISFAMAQDQNPELKRVMRFESAVNKIEEKATHMDVSAVHTVFVGSSSFTRWVDFESDFNSEEVVNNGFGGSRLSDVIFYFDKVITPFSPKQIIVYEGDNDIASGMSAKDYLKDVKTFIRMVEIKHPGTHISFLSPKPSPSRRELTEEFVKASQGLAMLASRTPGVDFIDVGQVMYDIEGEILKEIWVSDSLHMNRAGYDLWAPIVRSYIRR